MALGNTPRRPVNFSVEAAKSYAFGIAFADGDGVPIDITGSVVRISIAPERAGSMPVIEKQAVLTDPADGICQFQFQASDLDLPPASYVYDLTLLPPSGYSTPVLKGGFEIGRNVDLLTSNTYAGANTGTDLTVALDGADMVNVSVERIDGMLGVVNGVRQEVADLLAQAKAARDEAVAARDEANRIDEVLRSLLLEYGYPFWRVLSQAQYDALEWHDPNILYLIVDPEVLP